MNQVQVIGLCPLCTVNRQGLDVNSDVHGSDSDNDSVQRPVPIQPSVPKWVRVYPPENDFDAESKFRVRNPGPKNCPPRNSLPIEYYFLHNASGTC